MMKKRTIATMAVALVMVLSALLVPAFDTDAVRDGESEEQPRYIFGSGSAAEELGSGKGARINYNATSFANPAVTFSVKGESQYTDITLNGTPATGSAETEKNIKITITNESAGIYKVEFTPGTGPVGGKIIIKMTVKETYNGVSIPQDFYYAANFSTVSNVGKIVVGENGHTGIFYDQSTGVDAPTLTFQYGTDVSMALMTKENTGSADNPNWILAKGYSYYGTGLPDGISITVDGRIGGKLSSGIQTTTGTLEISAVKNGVTSSLKIPWNVGTEPTYDADFDLKVDGEVRAVVMKRLGDDQTILVKAEENGNGTINSYTVDARPSTVSDDDTSKSKKIAAYTGTGTYVVKVTAEMTKDGRSMTIVKTFTVHVVGGIYDGNLKPVVSSV